ncbi:MAG: hypothetical protein EOM29_10750 [Bacteroidia bacterium]|nr:hypothetical protein [Bacteroidia bacterium]
MKKIISLLVFVFIISFSNDLTAQNNYQDVVYLKNGSVIKGVIIEQIPNVSLKIKTKDENVFFYDMKDVEKMAKEEIIKLKIKNNYYNNDLKTKAQTYRDPAAATLLSFFIPGIGQFYNGQTGKGITHILWYLGSSAIMYISTIYLTTEYRYYTDGYLYYTFSETNTGAAIFLVASSASMLTAWIVSMIDANRSAKKINNQLDFAQFKLGEKNSLSFQPDVKLIHNNSLNIPPTLSYGLKINISF